MQQLLNIISSRIPNNGECARLFHGRGKKWPGYEPLSIDFYPPHILITTYKEISDTEIQSLVDLISQIKELPFTTILLQKRYTKGEPIVALVGSVPSESFAVENSEKYLLNLTTPQNIGFFLDMKEGRAFVKKHSQDKKVLNLFSYTCSLSVAAFKGKAREVVNVDTSKPALHVGEKNHLLNGIDKRSATFLPHDVLKSFGSIIRKGPYDLVIIDPPTNQGDSFQVKRDYHKIVKKLSEMTAENALIMACLNSPHLNSEFLLEMFKEHAPMFSFQEKMYSNFSEMEVDPEEGLKILIFRKER